MIGNQCDFCGIYQVEWFYPCLDFDVTGVAIHDSGDMRSEKLLESTSGWVACHQCSMYVDRKDWFFLAQRCTRMAGDELFGHRLSLFHAFERYRIKTESKRLVFHGSV